MPGIPVEMEISYAHWAVLRLLTEQPNASQRELSSRLGYSLGKTHYLLRALVAKGWIKAQNFKNNNKVAYSYLLTPSGIAHKLLLTRSFLRSKEQEFQQLRLEIEAIRNELATEDKT